MAKPLISQRLTADLALIGNAFIWGATFVIVKDALRDASPLVFLATRFSLATILLVVIFRRQLRATAAGWLAGVAMGVFLFAGFIFQTTGLQFTTPSKSAFITGISVVMVPVILAVAFRRWIGVWPAAGVLGAATGLYFLTMPPGQLGMSRGDLLTLACAFCFAMHIILVGRYSRQHPAGLLVVGQVATALVLALLSLPLVRGLGWKQALALRVTPRLAISIVVTAVLATALAFAVQVWAQQHTTATHTAIIFSLEPVFAWLTSYALFGERLGARGTLGALLIFGGIVLAELKGGTPSPVE